LEIDGTTLSTDPTFNHQLWFAACASLLKSPRSQEIRERICLFMDFLPENLFVLDNGLIYHPIKTTLNFNDSSRSIKLKLKNLIKILFTLLWDKQIKSNNSNKDFKKRMIYKSAGYHQFNMYAFAMVKQSFPDHSFWLTEQFTRSLDYLMTDKFVEGLMENKFGYPYNPPGFEVPFAISALTDMTEEKLVYETSMWINEQFKRCYNSDTRMMDRNTEDPLTHTARVYELTRLSNSILKKTKVDLEFVGDLRNNGG
tara:strand:- start:62 stop:826 length:765 start_codon:yes stop_codon:yes gene_type:complete